jgi:hypothetical protein
MVAGVAYTIVEAVVRARVRAVWDTITVRIGFRRRGFRRRRFGGVGGHSGDLTFNTRARQAATRDGIRQNDRTNDEHHKRDTRDDDDLPV